MLRGRTGLAGAGIYFATSPQATNRKAHHKGVILQAFVRLGRIKTVHFNTNISTINYQNLLNEGYDSVKITGLASGIEYVIYNWDQAINISNNNDRSN